MEKINNFRNKITSCSNIHLSTLVLIIIQLIISNTIHGQTWTKIIAEDEFGDEIKDGEVSIIQKVEGRAIYHDSGIELPIEVQAKFFKIKFQDDDTLYPGVNFKFSHSDWHGKEGREVKDWMKVYPNNYVKIKLPSGEILQYSHNVWYTSGSIWELIEALKQYSEPIKFVLKDSDKTFRFSVNPIGFKRAWIEVKHGKI